MSCKHLNVSIEVDKTTHEKDWIKCVDCGDEIKDFRIQDCFSLLKKEMLTQEEVDKRYGKKMIVIDPEKFKDCEYNVTIKDQGYAILDESSDFDWDNYFKNK